MSYSEYKKKVIRLKKDNRNGAAYIENELLKIFTKAAKELKKSDFVKLIRLTENWPAPMANIYNLTDNLILQLEYPKSEIESFLKQHQKHILISKNKVGELASSIIIKLNSIATLSASGLVYNSIKTAANKGWRGTVLVAESRPILEGKLLAAALAKLPVKVVFGADCQIFSMLDNVDAVFIGADMITGSYFINKTGTGALIATLGAKKKVYVLADLSKYYFSKKKTKIPEMPSEEVWRKHPPKVKIVNRYFEKIDFKKNIILVNDNEITGSLRFRKYLENR